MDLVSLEVFVCVDELSRTCSKNSGALLQSVSDAELPEPKSEPSYFES